MAVVAALAIVGIGACGGDKPDISDEASELLEAKVTEIRALASARDADGVTSTLSELRTLVGELQRDDELSETAADRIMASAAKVTANVVSITTTTTAPPPPDDEDKEDREDEDHGKGRKNGNGGD